jgi:hypothetical protein
MHTAVGLSTSSSKPYELQLCSCADFSLLPPAHACKPAELLRYGRMSPAIDVYSFGVMMHQLYTNQVRRSWAGLPAQRV